MIQLYPSKITDLNPNAEEFNILRYRIGYCRKGPYSGKIIIPSYDENASLNYFVARAYYEEDKWNQINSNLNIYKNNIEMVIGKEGSIHLHKTDIETYMLEEMLYVL